MKKIIIVGILIVASVNLFGCKTNKVSYGVSSKSIVCNIKDSRVILANVDFYDEYNGIEMKDVSEEFDIVSNTFSTKDMMIQERDGTYRIFTVHTDKEWDNLPKEMKVYTNRAMTEYDTYSKVK